MAVVAPESEPLFVLEEQLPAQVLVFVVAAEQFPAQVPDVPQLEQPGEETELITVHLVRR